MSDLIKLEIATPERQLVREEVAEILLPGKDGVLGILPGHAPLLSQLGCGPLSYKVGANRRFLAVDGGFVEVLPEQVRVLADMAERAEEIDVPRAKADLQKAEGELAGAGTTGVDPAGPLAAIGRAQARIAVAEGK